MAVSFPARNKLAYPAGTQAGINPSHPAAFTAGGEALVSAVCVGGSNFQELRTGTKSTLSGSGFVPRPADRTVGPSLYFDASTNIATFPIPGVSANSHVMAAIIRVGPAFNTGTNQYIVATYNNSGAGSAITVFDPSGGGIEFRYLDPLGTPVPFYSSVVANTPYFVAVSGLNNDTTKWVVRNLDTGEVSSGSISQANGATLESSLLTIGNRDGDLVRPSLCYTAAVMYASSPASKQLSVLQLQRWADDPWAFWYPSRGTDRVAAAAAAAAANNFTNLLLMGVG